MLTRAVGTGLGLQDGMKKCWMRRLPSAAAVASAAGACRGLLTKARVGRETAMPAHLRKRIRGRRQQAEQQLIGSEIGTWRIRDGSSGSSTKTTAVALLKSRPTPPAVTEMMANRTLSSSRNLRAFARETDLQQDGGLAGPTPRTRAEVRETSQAC